MFRGVLSCDVVWLRKPLAEKWIKYRASLLCLKFVNGHSCCFWYCCTPIQSHDQSLPATLNPLIVSFYWNLEAATWFSFWWSRHGEELYTFRNLHLEIYICIYIYIEANHQSAKKIHEHILKALSIIVKNYQFETKKATLFPAFHSLATLAQHLNELLDRDFLSLIRSLGRRSLWRHSIEVHFVHPRPWGAHASGGEMILVSNKEHNIYIYIYLYIYIMPKNKWSWDFGSRLVDYSIVRSIQSMKKETHGEVFKYAFERKHSEAWFTGARVCSCNRKR